MRHAIIVLFLVAVLPIETSHAQDNNKEDIQKGKITVLLTGFENDQGTVKLCLCCSEDEYTGKTKEFCTASKELKDKKAEWVLENMPYGRYSVKAFHEKMTTASWIPILPVCPLSHMDFRTMRGADSARHLLTAPHSR